jgi:hypothetical protein
MEAVGAPLCMPMAVNTACAGGSGGGTGAGELVGASGGFGGGFGGGRGGDGVGGCATLTAMEIGGALPPPPLPSSNEHDGGETADEGATTGDKLASAGAGTGGDAEGGSTGDAPEGEVLDECGRDDPAPVATGDALAETAAATAASTAAALAAAAVVHELLLRLRGIDGGGTNCPVNGSPVMKGCRMAWRGVQRSVGRYCSSPSQKWHMARRRSRSAVASASVAGGLGGGWCENRSRSCV